MVQQHSRQVRTGRRRRRLPEIVTLQKIGPGEPSLEEDLRKIGYEGCFLHHDRYDRGVGILADRDFLGRHDPPALKVRGCELPETEKNESRFLTVSIGDLPEAQREPSSPAGRLTMNGRLIALIAVAMIVLAASAAAEKPRDTREFATELASRIERFFLWNDCRPMRAGADLWSDDAESNLPKNGMLREMERSLGTSLFGLSHGTVISTIHDRLQAAHLHDDRASTRLHIHVRVSGEALRIEVGYTKPVLDLASRERFYAETWSSRSNHAHESDGGHVLSLVIKDVGRFIDEYLRVNRDSCERRRP